MCIAIGMECSKRWYKAVRIYKVADYEKGDIVPDGYCMAAVSVSLRWVG